MKQKAERRKLLLIPLLASLHKANRLSAVKKYEFLQGNLFFIDSASLSPEANAVYNNKSV